QEARVGTRSGGLSELAEKVMIVGDFGKQLIEEIPLDQTQPGFGRVPYVAHGQTSDLLAAATKQVNEVTFQPTTGNLAYHYEPGPGTGHQQQQPHQFAEPSPNVPRQDTFSNQQRYPGGLPPQPEPHTVDSSSEFGQFAGPGPAGQPYHSQTVSSDGGRAYPPRIDSRFATMPNASGRPDISDEPPSPAVPPKDAFGSSSFYQPPLPQPQQQLHHDPRESIRRSASGLSETGADLVLAYYHDLEATGDSVDSAPQVNQQRNVGAGIPGGNRNSMGQAPHHGAPGNFDDDPYASDAFRTSPSHPAPSTFPHGRDLSYDLPTIQPLRTGGSKGEDPMRAADAAAAREIAKELDISPSRPLPARSSSKGVLSKFPMDGGSMRGYPPGSPLGQGSYSAYDAQQGYGNGPPGPSSPTSKRMSGSPTSNRFEPAPTLSLSFTDADASLDFPGMTSSPIDPRRPGVMDDSRFGGRPRSPPPSFEVATSTPPTPGIEPRNILMGNYDPSALSGQPQQPNPERSLSASSAMSEAQKQQQSLGRSESNLSNASSLSTLPSPHPPFAADPTAVSTAGRGGTASIMPGSANSPPLSPIDPVTPSAKTISAGAFKRFRGPGGSPSPAGSPVPDTGSPLSTPFNVRKQPPPMEPTSSFQSAMSGNSNYASAPSSPSIESDAMGPTRRSLEGRGPGYAPSPLGAPPQGDYSRVSYISDVGQAPEGDPRDIGLAMGGDGQYDQQQSNRMTIGELGWKPMRYGSHVGADGLSEIIEESEPPSVSRRTVNGGYGSGRYATKLE
ncbi:hypothetical protein FRB90_008102, partial [Tulasnella sp. 427]